MKSNTAGLEKTPHILGQYLPHLPAHRLSSAAAALKLKSRESGAGRFTEFLLPLLSFAEFLLFEPASLQAFAVGQILNPWALRISGHSVRGEPFPGHGLWLL